MGFIDSFFGSAKTDKAPKEKGKLEAGDLVSNSIYSTGINVYSTPRNAEAMLSAYRSIPWLRAIVGKISESVASTTWTLTTKTGPGGEALPLRKIRSCQDWRTRRTMLKQSPGEVVDIDSHPLLDLLDKGNPYLTGHDVLQLSQTYIDLRGDAFIMMERSPLGIPVELYPVKPTEIQSYPSPSKPFYVVRHGGRTSEVSAEDMIRIKVPNPADPYGPGAGIAEAISQELDTDEACATYLRTYFSNGATPSALVSVPGSDPAELRRLASQWESQHRGPSKAHRVRFMNYDARVEKLDSNFSETGVVELRRFSRNLCLEVFGCPPEIFGVVENSNRATIDGAGYLYAKWVLTPRLERIRLALQNYLVPQFDDRILIDYESPIEEDRAFMLQTIQAQPYSFERGEVRELAGFPSHGEFDEVYMQPLSLYERRVAPGSVSPVEAPLPPGEAAGEEKAAKVVSKGINADAVDVILAAFEDSEEAERDLDRIKDLFEEELQKWGDNRLNELRDKKNLGKYTSKADWVNPETGEIFEDFIPDYFDVKAIEVQEFLESVPIRTKGFIDKDSYKHLRKTLIAGMEEGIGTEEIAKNIKGVFDNASMTRAKTIARTESGRAANFGTWKAQQNSGVVDYRQWVTELDTETRQEHIDLNGQIVGIDQEFEVNGFSTLYPGSFGVPGQDINCRCTTVPVMTELKDTGEPVAIQKQRRDQFMRELFPWELETEKAYRKRFKSQEKATLQALKRFGA